MLEIGRNRKVRLVTGFGANAEPVLDEDGKPQIKSVPEEIWRITRDNLGHHHGPDKRRRLVVGLLSGDILAMRPEGRRRETAEVQLTLHDVYAYALRSRAMSVQLEKARQKKAAKAARREKARIAAADRRMTRPL